MSEQPYLASEDSALLRGALTGYAGGASLEIGAGNGGNLAALSSRFGLVVGTDLKLPSTTDWKEKGANYILADTATCMKSSCFDLVAFNPPYLPEETADRTTQGGERLEVPKSFLREALRVVKREGKVVFLLSQLADMSEFGEICASAGFGFRRIASMKMFFEELTVYEASALRA
jgi:methylase of polypeptide subunit release factors